MVELSGFGVMFMTIAALAGLGLFVAFFNWSLLAPPAAGTGTASSPERGNSTPS
jgi:hypothetical protein